MRWTMCLCYNDMIEAVIGASFVCNVGVLLTAICLMVEMCEKSPDMLAHFRKVCTPDTYCEFN